MPVTPALVSGNKQISGAHWPTSLVKTACLQFSEKPCLHLLCHPSHVHSLRTYSPYTSIAHPSIYTKCNISSYLKSSVDVTKLLVGDVFSLFLCFSWVMTFRDKGFLPPPCVSSFQYVP